MPTRKKVEKDILDYCEANGIKDTESFIVSCMLSGLAVQKYGTSPIDNIRRQNDKPDDAVKAEEPVVVKKKKSIRVTKKKDSGTTD